MKALKLAVIGKDVSKSESPKMHKFIAGKLGFDVRYDNISVPEEEFEARIEGLFKEYDGLNVTIPYKLSVIPHLKSVTGDAAAFGAVNTVKTGVRTGYNTDGLGFMLMLKNNGVEVAGREILVMGAGGAGRSVAKKLYDGGAEVYVFDKRFESAKAVADEFSGVTALKTVPIKSYFAIVNATGVGMHRTEGISPVPDGLTSLCEVAVDLIYYPAKSRFLQNAEALGKKIINGEAMLFYQAYYAECIYWNVEPDERLAKRLFEDYRTEEL